MDQCIPGLDRGFESAIQAQHRKPALVDHQRTGGGIPVPQAEVPAAQRQAQKRRGAWIGLENQTVFADAHVAQRRQVVELEIARLRRLEFALDAAQLFVLHFQMNLAHPQLMHHALHLGRRHGLRLIERRRFARQRLGLAPQVAGALERFIFGGHCKLPFDGYRCDRLCTH